MGERSTVGSQFEITPIEEGCPWYSWTRPNVKWCEENLCAWVTAPANTYSNLLYIILGVVMIRQARKVRSRTLAMFGINLDGGIFVCISCFIHLCISDLRLLWYVLFCKSCLGCEHASLKHNHGRQTFVYWSLVMFCTCTVPVLGYFNFPYQLLVFGQVLVTLLQEVYLRSWSKAKAPIASQITSFTSQVCGTMPKRWVKCRSHLADFYRSLQTAP